MPDDAGKPEYVLVVETPGRWGGLAIVLKDKGTRLSVTRVEGERDKRLYQLLGVPMPDPLALDPSATKVVRADPNMLLLLYGQHRSLADVAASLYSRLMGLMEEREKKEALEARMECTGGSASPLDIQYIGDLEQRLRDALAEGNAVRESLLRAGIASGMFPPEYGLR